MSGEFKVDGSGNVQLKEVDGIDYAPVTVQLPGGERVPFLFSVKELEAKGTADGFGGEFVVPSYRGSTFLDPKGRGAATGYDNAVALPAAADAGECRGGAAGGQGALVLLHCWVGCAMQAAHALACLPPTSPLVSHCPLISPPQPSPHSPPNPACRRVPEGEQQVCCRHEGRGRLLHCQGGPRDRRDCRRV
jgi:hypothetical protein